MSMSAFDNPCIKWTKFENYEVTSALVVDDVAKARNYCRKLADPQWNSPTCVINGADNKQVVEKCDIDFCGTLG